jgi:hypothetical protein
MVFWVVILCSEEGASKIIWNIYILSCHYTVSQPRRPWLESSSLWIPHILLSSMFWMNHTVHYTVTFSIVTKWSLCMWFFILMLYAFWALLLQCYFYYSQSSNKHILKYNRKKWGICLVSCNIFLQLFYFLLCIESAALNFVDICAIVMLLPAILT